MSQQRRSYAAYDDTGTARYLHFTDGEKMIWSAVFARFWTSSAVSAMTNDERTLFAARSAHDAVLAARGLAVTLRGDDSEHAFMARQMVNRRKADEDQDNEVMDVYGFLGHYHFRKTQRIFCEEAGIERDEEDDVVGEDDGKDR